MSRNPKGTPTSLNLWVLADMFAGIDRVPNKVTSARARHVRRLLAAGLLTADRDFLTLTEAGKLALRRQDAKAAENRAVLPAFDEAECDGTFDGFSVSSDADSGL
jgi:hypothetical protein